MVDLLKQKSKIIIERKERKTFDEADVFGKKRKINNDIAQSQVQPQATSSTGNKDKDPKKIQPKIIEKFDVHMSTKQ